jgi:phosphoadenosine phosphosulfate reductase
MLAERERRGKMVGTWKTGTTGEDVFHWWMEDGVLQGQTTFDDITEGV